MGTIICPQNILAQKVNEAANSRGQRQYIGAEPQLGATRADIHRNDKEMNFLPDLRWAVSKSTR